MSETPRPIAVNLAEAAAMLSVSESLVRKLCAAGTLPCARLGRSVRILESDVLKLFRARQAEAQPKRVSLVP